MVDHSPAGEIMFNDRRDLALGLFGLVLKMQVGKVSSSHKVFLSVSLPPSARQPPPTRGRWRLRQKGSGGPAGPEGENFAITRNISDCRKVLSPTRCGGSPLAEGAKESTIYQTRRLALSGSLLPSSNS